jgi:hypothetical protein
LAVSAFILAYVCGSPARPAAQKAAPAVEYNRSRPAQADEETGSKVCAGCHSEIARRYLATSMARSSGAIGPGTMVETFDHARFTDVRLGAEYRVSLSPDGYRLEFARDATGARGDCVLRWFVGSGRVARSYILSREGFLFQAPVSYYATSGNWAVSPGFEQHKSIHFTRSVTTKCLQCHASRLQPVAGTDNRFANLPFREGGVSCERCHGPGGRHVSKMLAGDRTGIAEIVNPEKLTGQRRDSICAQCHLTGAARVARSHPPRPTYRPGDLLSDYTEYFVWNGASGAMNANSHFEKLWQSACKRAGGDKLWCGSCHDPHGEPAPAERVNFYRARCSKCHTSSACTEKPETRRGSDDDCIGCHMPKAKVRDTEHAVFTDHSIPRRQALTSEMPDSRGKLEQFWKTPAGERDLGLAYAAAAAADPELRAPGLVLLRKAAARDPGDVPVLMQLAQFADEDGREEEALARNQGILRLDPSQTAVAVNLGVALMKQGRVQDAIRLWQDALARNPGLTGARINLAVAQYRSGEASRAQATLRKALEYDPDEPAARKLLAEIQSGSR